MIVDLNDSRYANMDEITATHAMAEEITKLTAMRTDLKHEVRSYEVSLWTLQDEFITVLKWSDAEQRGRIENPQMKINVDGTQNFTFTIPMYLYVEVFDSHDEHITHMIKKENPIWYNTQNGNLMVGLNKIKVIFNKGQFSLDEASDHIFEFIITKVTESHEDNQLLCNIECEGLAFHELGKIGYKISLSQDNFILDETDYEDKGYWTKNDGTNVYSKPIENVQYWCEQCGLKPMPSGNALLNPTIWYYKIQMNWGSFNGARASDTVFENEYVSAWDNNLTPISLVSAREKMRPIEANQSNIYNITQNIAETFEIYCKYKYHYDDNYHIIGREVIYYNNYLNENNVLSFTYPYSTSSVSREMDVSEITTKMYVQPQDNDSVVSGTISIADCLANKTKEDYLLNFEYLYMIGAITKEQYDAIPEFEKDVRIINVELEDLNAEIMALEDTLVKQKALEKVYSDSCVLDDERINYNSALYSNIEQSDGNTDGFFTRGVAHPYSTYAKLEADGLYHIQLSDEDPGVHKDYIMIFRSYNSQKQTFRNRITGFATVLDSTGYVKEIVLPSNFTEAFTTDAHPTVVNTTQWTATVDNSVDMNTATGAHLLMYLVYKYQPKLYSEKVNQIWMNKKKEDEDAQKDAKQAVENAKSQLEIKKSEYTAKLAEKNNLIQKFEHMMGPALREGYWQPDNYKDHGRNYTSDPPLMLSNYSSSVLVNDTGENAVIGWDETLFDDEDTIYFEESVLRTKVFYPCIRLSGTLLNKFAGWVGAGVKPSFIFNNNYYRTLENDERNSIQNLKLFTLGGSMKLGFIHQSGSSSVLPVLILTGASEMTNEQIRFMITSGQPKLGVVDIDVNGQNQASIAFGDGTTALSTSDFYWDTSVITSGINSISNFSIVYPRIKISSNELHVSSISIKYNDDSLTASKKILTNFEDYQTLSRTTIDTNNKARLEYFITIKPEALFNRGKYINSFIINYTISNAATSIYLDAQDIMIDSSKPKVSYTIKVNALNIDYIKEAYKSLAQLVMINDNELKFENTFGYISELDLNLDQPQEDEIEVKNYKTKFEDLFSTIVASSEELRRNGAAFNAAANGGVPLSSGALSDTLSANEALIQAYLDSLYGSSEVVRMMLAELFTEAGTILACAESSLSEVKNLNIKNSSILSGFLEKISANLAPNVVTSVTQPTNFKTGDIWNQTDSSGTVIGRYVATTGSNETAGGYTRTFDGTLAAIKGASLDIDTVTGKLNILAENRIDMKSGGNIYIAANEKVEIVGNDYVKIGGTQINIGSTSIIGNGTTSTVTGGINLVATGYSSENFENTVASKVLIKPEKITMFGNEIEMMAGAATDNAIGASAVRISGQEGIWLGSNAGVVLYSGAVSSNTILGNSSSTSVPSGATIELKPNHLLFGVSTASNGSAVKITDDGIIIATGTTDITTISNSNNSNGISGVTGGTTGVRIKRDFFGIAISNNNTISAIIMNDKGITLGSGVVGLSSLGDATNQQLQGLQSGNGSAVRISGSGIMLNSNAYLSVNTGNVVINSLPSSGDTVFRLGPSNNVALQYVSGTGLTVKGNLTATTLQVGDSSSSNYLSYNGSTLTIKGNMTVSDGSTIAGWTVGTSALSANNGTVALASSGTYSMWAGQATPGDTFSGETVTIEGTTYNVISARGAPFRVTPTGRVYMDYLMLWDSVNHIYKEIDFSDFNQAVSLTLRCSGQRIYAKASYWGKFDKEIEQSASASASVGALDNEVIGFCTTTVTVNTSVGNLVFDDVSVNANTVYQAGWSAAAGKCGNDYNGENYIIIPASEYHGISGLGSTTQFSIQATYDNGYKDGWNACRDAMVELTGVYSRTDGGGKGGPDKTHYLTDGSSFTGIGDNWYKTSAISGAYGKPGTYESTH